MFDRTVHLTCSKATTLATVVHSCSCPAGYPTISPRTRNCILGQQVVATLYISCAASSYLCACAGSGAPNHFHVNAANILVYGRKRWFLSHPNDATYSREHVVEWLERKGGYDQSRVLECVQQPGDLIFVPTSWGHAVLNLQTSIGAAFEILHLGSY